MNLVKLSISALVLASTTSVVQADYIGSEIARIADAGGLTDRYLAAGWKALGFYEPISSVTRPDGGTSLQQQLFGGLSQSYSAGEIDGWLATRISGTWTLGYEDGGTEQFSTAGLYTAAANRSYTALTADSYALWVSIMNQGLSGTFTFHVTDTVESLGYDNLRIGVGISQAVITSGSSFTLNVDGAVAAQFGLLSIGGGRITGTATTPSGYGVNWDEAATTYYIAPVPAPGAAALIFLVGAVGSRRRR